MKLAHIIVFLLFAISTANAGPYYVRYFQDDGTKTAYATDFPLSFYTIETNGTYFMGDPDPTRRQGVFATYLDPAPSTGRSNISQFADATILNPTDLSYSIKSTAKWVALTNSIAEIHPLMDAQAAAISAEPNGPAKDADKAIQNVTKQLLEIVKRLRFVSGEIKMVEP